MFIKIFFKLSVTSRVISLVLTKNVRTCDVNFCTEARFTNFGKIRRLELLSLHCTAESVDPVDLVTLLMR